MQLVRREHSLWPADVETAAACGVPFAPVSLDKDSGEWLPSAPKSDKSKPADDSAKKAS